MQSPHLVQDSSPIDQLMSAVRAGDADVARRILERNPTIDINAEYGECGDTTLLHEAGSAAVVRLLLSPPRPHEPYREVNMVPGARDYVTPLARACRAGREGVVRGLLGVVGVDPNMCNPLWETSSDGRAGIVRLLLGHPATNVNNTSPSNWFLERTDCTPLTEALLRCHWDVAHMLLAHGGTVDEEKQDQVDEAMGGHNKYLQWLIQCAHHQVGNQKMVNQMISLIPADISDFTLEKLLGTGASAAAFKVLFSNGPSVGATTTAITSNKSSSMVMKVLFNWESTPRHTRLRQKYMAECAILSSIPPHPNVIHPLGALVIPRLPDEFIEQIPASQPFFREMALNKSLAFIMPFGGIPLSSFLQSLVPSPVSSSSHGAPWDVTVNLFQQALKAVNHIETNKFIHRDIKEDNVLVDPETKTLSLIDFGEAIQCLKPDLEVEVSSSNMQLWGNTGTMPPELSALLRTLRATGPTLFSYSKCDSFALAVTFWDALLPPQRKFIGSTLNTNMATFTPAKLAASFPDPLSFFPRATVTGSHPQSSGLMKDVMLAMMEPDKKTRIACLDALECLSGPAHKTKD
ncbi:hypothetical protein Pelo_18490 [Pelomyxa schiedti]|nr:hypothetical protein Pelo_18490 [Pelomyxa schiedti]